MSIASLPMYDLPELAAATDAWWQAIARAMRREGIADVPDRLTRGGDYMGPWGNADLLFSQACGYPFTHAFRDSLDYIATPRYDAPGCQGAGYCSFVVVRAGDPAQSLADLRGRRCAVNATHSHSGYNVLRAMLAPLVRGAPFFGEVKTSGSHVTSMQMVIDNAADVASIDGVTLALVARHRPAMAQALRTVAQSPPAPGLPYVTARGKREDVRLRLRESIGAAFGDSGAAEARRALLIAGIQVLDDGAYAAIDKFETDAIASGYPEIR
ncbi:MAG TPA: PhnD/SsuA/transferrin family substrate-binding protein [Dongiaceae bacterium]|jgi:ABC-type phosphate/phosphonate transport system substrate-binding protein